MALATDGGPAYFLRCVIYGIIAYIIFFLLLNARKLAVKQYEKNRGIDRQNLKMPVHIDVSNHKFEIEDLKKLIQSTTNDLEEADKKRREDFKTYEMEKKFEKEERLRHIQDEEARGKERQKLEEMQNKHKQHEKLKHPMTKDQLEEVWEEQDHMQPEDWDPKTFFAMHDLNGDGYWEEDELKVRFYIKSILARIFRK